jgi:NAD(P)-dependent dehydrogenase (short-subunit alcohol dehydrogenase family)
MPDRPGPILVTGANSGIGLESSLRFARRRRLPAHRRHPRHDGEGAAAGVDHPPHGRRRRGVLPAAAPLLIGADALTVGTAGPFLPRALTDAAARVITNLPGP